MSGVPEADAGELALDPDFEESLFEDVADANGQLGDGEDAPGRQGPFDSLGSGGASSLAGRLFVFKRKIEQVAHLRLAR